MGDPWWWQQCKDNIAKMPGDYPYCAPEKCFEMSYREQVCYCLPPYQNGCQDPPTPGCCAYTATSPIILIGESGPCWCCCGGGVWEATAVGAGGGATAIHEIAVGDVVRAALDPKLEHWALMPARFSSGTGAGASGPGLHIRFGDPHELETALADPDQLFLVDDGRLKRASRLVAGKDRLTRPDGSRVEIFEINAVDELGPRHRIATSEGPSTDWSGHLIVVNGVVCGDYSLQLADLDSDRPEMMAEGHADLPAFGTAAYAACHDNPTPQGE